MARIPVPRGGLAAALLFTTATLPAQVLGPAASVKAWEGTVRLRGRSTGTHSHSVMGEDEWNISYSADLQVRLDNKFNFAPIWWGSVGGHASIDATQAHTLSGCTTTNTLKGNGAPQVPYEMQQANLSFHSDGTYYFTIGATEIPAHWAERTQCAVLPRPPQDADDLYSYFPDQSQLEGVLPTNPADLVLRGSGVFTRNAPFVRDSFLGVEPPVEIQVEWELRPAGPAEEDEVIILLTDEYRQFRPEAADGGGAGSGLRLTARLQKKGGGAPTSKAMLFKWQFVNCSREPGYAMNAPESSPETGPDLRFEATSELLVAGEEGQSASTPPGQWETSTAPISAHDWGAWGAIRVTAVMPDGRRLIAYLEGDPAQTDIRLPKRADGDLIAEVWRQQQGIDDSDSADNENDPVGDGTPGDGLTLYEEYRGFIENGYHIEGNPKKKDYFIHSRVGGAYLPGLRLFRRLSGLEVHYQFTALEFSVDRVVNFNHAQGPHRVDQHGVMIFPWSLDPGYAVAKGGPGNPVKIEGVFIKALAPPVSRQEADYYNSTLAHELFHACNVYHHGDSGDTAVTWRRLTGTTIVLEKSGGVEQPISVLREDGTLINAIFPERPINVLLGVKEGPHCGHDDCVMRYDVSRGYAAEADPALRYRVVESTGFNLCSDAAGTGVNEAGRTPQSRYGPSASGRGACSTQILVNDAVPAPER